MEHKESKTARLDDFLKEKLEKAYHRQTLKVFLHKISKIASEHSPIDLAYSVSHLPVDARVVLYDNLPTLEAKISFILNTDNQTRVKIFRYIKDQEIKKLFEKMPTDEVVWISEDMSQRKFKRIMELIEKKKACLIKDQRKHHRNSAGRLMSNEFFAFKMDMKIKEVSRYIRNNPKIDFIKGVFIINDKNELLGFVPARNLLINSRDVSLKKIMKPILYKVTTDSTREEVVDIVERYKVSSLPVVDKENKLVGIIANEDVIEVMEDLADDTISKITGTTEKASTKDPLFKKFLARSPWLVVTLFAGIVNMGVMSSFESYAGKVLTFVLFFVPLVTGMSGNVGIQCSTVLVRNMALGLKSKREAILKELMTGVFTGVIFGIICAVVVYTIDLIASKGESVFQFSTGIIVGIGLIGACFAGTFLGVFSPIFFERLGVDPAISSGPIVTAFNDFFSMSIYFLISLGLAALLFG